MRKARKNPNLNVGGTKVGQVFAFLLFILCLLCIGTHQKVAAAENVVDDLIPDKKSDLKIIVQYEVDSNKDGKPETITVSGMKVLLYKVASLSTSGGGAYYTSLPRYASASIQYEGMTASDSLKAAEQLSKLSEQINPDREAVTASDGSITFNSLEPGIYLAVQADDSGNSQNVKVGISPCLWMVPQPQFDESAGINHWQYQVSVFPKAGTIKIVETEPATEPPKENPKKNNPSKPSGSSGKIGGGNVKTGDTTPITELIVLMLAAVGVIAAVFLVRKKRRT